MAKFDIHPKFFKIKYSPVKEYDDSLEIILAKAIVDTVRSENVDSMNDMRKILTSKLQGCENNKRIDLVLCSEQYAINLYAYYAKNNARLRLSANYNARLWLGVKNNSYIRGKKTFRTGARKIGLAASAIVGAMVSKKVHDAFMWFKHFYIEHLKNYGDGFSKTMEKVPGIGKFFADRYEDTKRTFDHTGATLSDWFNITKYWKSAILGVGIAIGLTYGGFKLYDIYTMNKFEHDLVQKGIELYRDLHN